MASRQGWLGVVCGWVGTTARRTGVGLGSRVGRELCSGGGALRGVDLFWRPPAAVHGLCLPDGPSDGRAGAGLGATAGVVQAGFPRDSSQQSVFWVGVFSPLGALGWLWYARACVQPARRRRGGTGNRV